MANKVYVVAETTLTWDDSVSNEDLESSALGADVVSECGSYVDLGSASRSEWYLWEMFIDGFGSGTLVVGESVDLYFSTSQQGVAIGDFDGPPDETPSASARYTLDATSNAERKQKLPNLLYAGPAIVYSTTTTENLSASGVIRLPGRYVSPVVHNKSGGVMATVDTHTVKLTPIPPEIQ